MPLRRNPDGTWSIGSGKAKYKTKKSAMRAYRAYLAKKGRKKT